MQANPTKESPIGVVPYIVAVSLFMQNIDSTVIATALPQIGRSFGIAPENLGLTISAYILTVAVFIPVSGWMTHRFGARNVFAAAIGVFTLASALCGASSSFSMLLLARIFQGIGGSMMVPVGRAIVMSSTPKSSLLRAMSMITWPALIAPILGPPIGGFITSYASWRWIFYVNLPIGLIAIALALRFISGADTTQRRPFDGMGFVLIALSMGGLMYGFDEIASPHGALWVAGVILTVAIVLGALFIRHARRHLHPILDLSAFEISVFKVNMAASFLYRSGCYTIPFLVPLMLQIGFGMTAVHAGSLMLVGAIGDLGLKTVTTPILRRFGFRPVMIVTCLLTLPIILAFDLLTQHSADWEIGLALICYGTCRSMGFTAYNTLAVADVPKHLIGATSTLTSMFMQASLGIGIAYASVILHLGSWLIGGTPDAVSPTAFHLAFIGVTLLLAGALLCTFMLPAQAGAEMGTQSQKAR